MRRVLRAMVWVVRITGPIQVVLGLSFWTGHTLNLVSLHMAVGLAFVLSLLALSVLAGRAGAGVAWASAGVVWSLLVLGVGITHTRWLPGANHWIAQTAHLIVGGVAMVLANWLARRATGVSVSANEAPAARRELQPR